MRNVPGPLNSDGDLDVKEQSQMLAAFALIAAVFGMRTQAAREYVWSHPSPSRLSPLVPGKYQVDLLGAGVCACLPFLCGI